MKMQDWETLLSAHSYTVFRGVRVMQTKVYLTACALSLVITRTVTKSSCVSNTCSAPPASKTVHVPPRFQDPLTVSWPKAARVCSCASAHALTWLHLPMKSDFHTRTAKVPVWFLNFVLRVRKKWVMLKSCFWKKFFGVSATLYGAITLLLEKLFLAVVSTYWIYKWRPFLYISNLPAFNMSNCNNHSSLKDKANRGRGHKNNFKAASHKYYTECLQNHFYPRHLEVLSKKMTKKKSLSHYENELHSGSSVWVAQMFIGEQPTPHTR